MSDDLIDYKKLVRDSLRHVVRAVIQRAATHGLPGDHHFYISFRTTAPGVLISDRLKAQYPEEMTIVLQHQFWDLQVTDEAFSVALSFNRVKEPLTIPFTALVRFQDPIAPFGLSFDVPSAEKAGPTDEEPEPPAPEPEGGGSGNVVSLDRFRNK